MMDAGPRHAFASSLDPGAADNDVLNFDDNRTWGPKLTAALGGLLTDNMLDRLVTASPQYIEDACELLFSCADRARIVGATLAWIRSTSIAGYHGGRLKRSEVESIRARGLLPLQAEARHARLTRALSPHPRWGQVAHRLDAALRDHGSGERAGRREGQVHLTLSDADWSTASTTTSPMVPNSTSMWRMPFSVRTARNSSEPTGGPRSSKPPYRAMPP